MESAKKRIETTDRKNLLTSVKESFIKLKPVNQVKNPVMFIVFIGAIITT